jgi:hypothetical protein
MAESDEAVNTCSEGTKLPVGGTHFLLQETMTHG